MTQGHSFRYSDNTSYINQNSTQSLLKGQIVDHSKEFEISLQLQQTHKIFLLNGKKVSAKTIQGLFPVVIFSPESLSAIKEGDEQRRALIDQHLSIHSIRNIQKISDYKKVLKTRNRVLKDHQKGFKTKTETLDLLESLKQNFVKSALALTLARIDILQKITPWLNNAMQVIFASKNVDISVDYVISGVNSLNLNHSELLESLIQRMQELAQPELATGMTLVGPHKHDIKFLYNGNDSRFYCSQGQQRALILSYKMAQIVYHRQLHGTEPVLMLDDVLSELDSEKRMTLISFLQEIKSQIFITTTDLSLPQEIQSYETSVFRIDNGRIDNSIFA